MNEIKQIVEVLEKVNATNIKVFDFERKSPFFDYVIIATVNARQSVAAVNYLKEQNLLNTDRVEGRNTGWTLIDTGNVIIHLFDAENRKYYNFDERLLGIKEFNI